MPAEADFGRFWADSGHPFGLMFGTFHHFLGGRNFDRFLIDFRDTFWEARRSERCLRKFNQSLQTPKTPKDCDRKFHHALHPEGVRRIQTLRAFRGAG